MGSWALEIIYDMADHFLLTHVGRSTVESIFNEWEILLTKMGDVDTDGVDTHYTTGVT